MIGKLLKDYFKVPLDLEKKFHSFYVTYSCFNPISFVIHLIFIPVFFVLKVDILAYFNIGSAVVWFLCISMLHDKRYHFLLLLLGTFELFLHAMLCQYFLGWDLGFQFYIVAAPIGVLQYPSKKIFLKIVFICITFFVGLVFVFYRDYQPVFVLDEAVKNVFFAFNFMIPIFASGMISFLYSFTTIRIESEIEVERNKSESLLLNILPVTIADQLKEDPNLIADSYEKVTVLFADIVNFTPLAERMLPGDMIMLLNRIFSEFDELCDRYGLEKIKTIGDAYMITSGLPVPCDNHAESIADCALDMMKIIKTYHDDHNRPLKLRIGINSGQAVAGVIGKRKFIYDLWGDTVNTAARMESHGVPDEIQVSGVTYQLLKNQYLFEKRGYINVKGKGEMETYFLKGSIAEKGTTC